MARLVIPFALVCSMALLGQDDVLKLKSGAKFEGRIVSETETTVSIQFPGGMLELRRDLIASIERGAADGVAGGPDPRPVLAGLTRFRDGDEFFFLYQSGRRVGWRVVETRREIRNGVAGYVRRDRLAFTAPAGGPPEVDLHVLEFVDAELKPVEVQQRMTAGNTMRIVEGTRDGAQLRLVEREAGRTTERLALFGAGVEVPGFLIRRLAVSPVPQGGYPTFRLFDPRDLGFRDVTVTRSLERVNVHGGVTDVLVFRRRGPEGVLETWIDMQGRTLREEIGSRSLVAVSADQKRVYAFAAGDAKSGSDDLGLRVSCDEAGVSLDRPDLSWEVQPGSPEKGLLASMVKAASRATVDVFEVASLDGAVTGESAAFEVLGRLQKSCEGFTIDGPEPQTIGDCDGLRFTVECKRRETRLKTMGFLVPRQSRMLVVLCAAPVEKFEDVQAAFLRIVQSLKVETDAAPSPPPPNPHEQA